LSSHSPAFTPTNGAAVPPIVAAFAASGALALAGAGDVGAVPDAPNDSCAALAAEREHPAVTAIRRRGARENERKRPNRVIVALRRVSVVFDLRRA
jgi:hypothetical protein